LAPECFTTDKASKEIACGRRPIEPKEEKDKNQVGTMGLGIYGKNTILATVDKALDVVYDEKEIERLMVVGLWCTHPDYNLRPSIRQVMQCVAV
jgi:hypothetical protein